MKTETPVANMQFLAGGGEMGRLIRAKEDWSKTAIGDPNNWPQSLRTTLNILLNSNFPMFLWWGPDLIQFYNDAYRPSLGNEGKHPTALGQKAIDCWPEIWPVIKPLIDQVLQTGEATWSENQLIPIYRNGHLEDVYWTFSYSAVKDENGNTAGVLVVCNETSGQVLALKKLEDSEARTRLAVEAAALGTFDLNLLTYEIIISKRFREIFGFNNADVSYNDIIKTIHPNDLLIRENANSHAMIKDFVNYEVRVVWDDKSIHRVNILGNLFWDENKKPVRLLGTVMDLTEQNTLVESYRENEYKFRILADSMPQLVWIADRNGKINYYNRSFLSYSGLTGEQIYNGGWLQMVHPNDEQKSVEAWEKAIARGSDFFFEHRFRRYDGIYRWQLSRAKPQKDAAGNIKMWVGTSTDIEDQKTFTTGLEKQVLDQNVQIKNTSQELIKSEQRYHLMVGEVQDYAILFLNSNGIIENWNKGAEKIKGYTAEEIIGKSFSVFYTKEDRLNQLPQTLLNKARQTGKALQEGWRVRKDGTLFWASVVITALHNEQGDVIGFTKVTRDLTDKRNADEKIKIHAAQLEQKNKELEKINAELKSFAYVSSHDLQEPLRKIRTFSSSILEKENQNLSEKGKDYFNRIQQSAGRMQTLIEDLLAYSRTSITERIFINTDIKEIITDVKNEFDEVLAEKNAAIDIYEMCKVNIIPFQFRQLMHNLISNSLKFSRPNTPTQIKIKSEIVKGNTLNIESLSPQKAYCHITISDNGIGFDPQYKERIFDIFQRLHGRDQYKGTGIGLAIVKKIIENHNGAITATGNVDKGATFDIYIPA